MEGGGERFSEVVVVIYETMNGSGRRGGREARSHERIRGQFFCVFFFSFPFLSQAFLWLRVMSIFFRFTVKAHVHRKNERNCEYKEFL